MSNFHHIDNAHPIISSLLDTDFYKITMMQCVFHHFTDTQAQYKLICRKNSIGDKLGPIHQAITQQIKHLCQLKFTQEELDYLRSLSLFQEDFLTYLETFSLNFNSINITADLSTFNLIISGPWLETILFEVPILAIISECYTRTIETPDLISHAQIRLENKINSLKNYDQQALSEFKFSDFGTRRRFSRQWQFDIVHYLQKKIPHYLYGTSNILLSKLLNLHPIGTMAHEYLQAFQILAPNLATHQQTALITWLKEYNGLLSIALTDVINLDGFLQELTPELANQYRGLRHDSGDPILWGNKIIDYYHTHHISPKDKMLVFSDSLTFPKMLSLYQHFHETIPVLFGIGTNLTNDFTIPSLNIVIKLTHINHQAVVKISDTPQKLVCEDFAILDKLAKIYKINIK